MEFNTQTRYLLFCILLTLALPTLAMANEEPDRVAKLEEFRQRVAAEMSFQAVAESGVEMLGLDEAAEYVEVHYGGLQYYRRPLELAPEDRPFVVFRAPAADLVVMPFEPGWEPRQWRRWSVYLLNREERQVIRQLFIGGYRSLPGTREDEHRPLSFVTLQDGGAPHLLSYSPRQGHERLKCLVSVIGADVDRMVDGVYLTYFDLGQSLQVHPVSAFHSRLLPENLASALGVVYSTELVDAVALKAPGEDGTFQVAVDLQYKLCAWNDGADEAPGPRIRRACTYDAQRRGFDCENQVLETHTFQAGTKRGSGRSAATTKHLTDIVENLELLEELGFRFEEEFLREIREEMAESARPE